MDIKSIRKIYVHEGAFSTDDVIAVAMIKLICPTIDIKRLREVSLINGYSIYLGVKIKNQVCTKNAEIKDKYGSFNCFSTYVFEMVSEELLGLVSINDKDKAREMFNQRYLSRITVEIKLSYNQEKIFKGKTSLFRKGMFNGLKRLMELLIRPVSLLRLLRCQPSLWKTG